MRALMFDFNGTLSDDEPLLCGVYRELFAKHGRPLTEEQYYSGLAGLADDAIIGGWLGVDGPLLGSLVAERIDRYTVAAAGGSTVSEPTRDAVRLAASRVPVAIVSGAFQAEIVPVIEAAGLAAEFTAIVAADDVERGKPDPEGYLLALDQLALDASDVVAFEDTEPGIAAAKAAGLRCLAVRGTLPESRLAEADEIIDGIEIALIERILAGS